MSKKHVINTPYYVTKIKYVLTYTVYMYTEFRVETCFRVFKYCRSVVIFHIQWKG